VRSSAVARRRSAGMSHAARTRLAAIPRSRTTPVATGIAEVPGCGVTPMAGRPRSGAVTGAYFHVVYTLPSELRDIAYQNKRVIYDLLMKAAAETTLAIASDPKRLGARIGVTAVLHSWGSALTHHPHVHMIVPGGGLSLDGTRWVAARSNFLVHVNLLARLFRGKMLAMLMHAHDAGELKFFNTHAGLADKRTFQALHLPAAAHQVGRPLQGSVRRAGAGAALSLPLHPSCRHLEPPPRCSQ